MENKIYTGIGSRDTPQRVLAIMEEVAEDLASIGYILRSGGAKGADQAFERGCDKVKGKKEIFLPWKAFENNNSPFYNICDEAIRLAKYYHPRPNRLSQGALKLMSRNIYQILGYNLLNPVPSDFVLCYHEGSGGTTQAVRVAENYKIKVFNFYNTDINDIRKALNI